MVAAIAATEAAVVARMSERTVASFTCALAQALSYQRSDVPSQIAMESPALKE